MSYNKNTLNQSGIVLDNITLSGQPLLDVSSNLVVQNDLVIDGTNLLDVIGFDVSDNLIIKHGLVVNGADISKVFSGNGFVELLSTTESTAYNNGSCVLLGGLGVAKNINCNETMSARSFASSNPYLSLAANGYSISTPSNNGLYVNPVRQDSGASLMNSLFYNTSTNEIFYASTGGSNVNTNSIQSASAGDVNIITDTNSGNINIGSSSHSTTNMNSGTTVINNLSVSSAANLYGNVSVGGNLTLNSGFSLVNTSLAQKMFLQSNISDSSTIFVFPCSYSFYINVNMTDYTSNSYANYQFMGTIHNGSVSVNHSNIGSFVADPTITIPSSGQIQLNCSFTSGHNSSAFGYFLGF